MKLLATFAVAGATLFTVPFVATEIILHRELKQEARLAASEMVGHPQAFLTALPKGTTRTVLNGENNWFGKTVTVLRKRSRTVSASNTGDCVVVVKYLGEKGLAPVACP